MKYGRLKYLFGKSYIFETTKLFAASMSSTSPCFSFLNDQDIVDALRSSNQAVTNKAMKCLDSYKPLFYNWILKIFRNTSFQVNQVEVLKDLEDVYQDTMYVIFKNKDRLKPNGEFMINPGENGSIKAYIFGCGRHIYILRLKKLIKEQQNNKKYEEKLRNEMLLNLLNNTQEEKAANVQQAIKELKEDCRELLPLRFTDGLSLMEIFKIINENLNQKDSDESKSLTVEERAKRDTKVGNIISQRLLRCREKLKELLITKYGFPDSFV